MWETWVWSLGWEDPLEKEMATQSSILAWKMPWTEEPGGPQSMGSQRVRHDWATPLSFFSFTLPNLPLFTPCTPHFSWKGKKCRMKGWTTHWGWIFTPFLSLPLTLPSSALVVASRCNSPWLIVGTISICYLLKWAKRVIVSGWSRWEHKESSAVLISEWNLLVERCCLLRAGRVVLRIQMSWPATQIIQPQPDLRFTTDSSFLVCFLNIAFYYLFTLAVLHLCCCTRAFLQLQKAASCGLRASHCIGFSCYRAWALGRMGSVAVIPGLQSAGLVFVTRQL